MSDTQDNEREQYIAPGVRDDVIVDSDAYLDSLREKMGDLPLWMAKLARAIVRDCTTPGTYQIKFTVESHRRRVNVAVISRVETIRRLGVSDN